MEWTDEEAAEQTQKGNQQAFRLLVERYSRPIFRLAFRMTGDEQDAEDLVQETFLRAYKRIDYFDARASFGTWIYRIATNCSVDHLRARKVRRQVQSPAIDAEATDWMESMPGDAPSPERLMQSGEVATMLRSAMDELTAPERAAFVLRHYEGRRIEEIASRLNVGQGAAKQAVFRAVQKLRRALEPMRQVTR